MLDAAVTNGAKVLRGVAACNAFEKRRESNLSYQGGALNLSDRGAYPGHCQASTPLEVPGSSLSTQPDAPRAAVALACPLACCCRSLSLFNVLTFLLVSGFVVVVAAAAAAAAALFFPCCTDGEILFAFAALS